MGTRRYILGKVLQALLTLAFVMLFNFFLFRVIPEQSSRAVRPKHGSPSPPRTSSS